ASILAVVTAGIAVRNAANASRQHAIAFSRELAAESLSVDPTNPVTARRLAVAAWRVFPTTEASSAMTALLAEQQQNGILPADPREVSDVAFSPNGKLLATAGSGTVRLWDPVTRQPAGAPLQTHGSEIGVSFSPSGKLVAAGRLWDPVTHDSAALLTGSGARGVSGWAFSPDGKLLATAGSGTVRLWDPVTRRPAGAALRVAGSHVGLVERAARPE